MLNEKDQIEFMAENDACGVAALNELCNDGRAWIVCSTFGRARATPVVVGHKIPRSPAGDSRFCSTHFWQNGAWHKRRPATAAQQRREQEIADRASGVSDGGNELRSFKQFFRRLGRKTRQIG